MALLIDNQAAFVGSLRETDRAHVEYERRHLELKRETDERFARIEAQMAEIIRVLNEHGRLLERLPEVIRDIEEHGRILAEHTRILERLPEAIREKIGFKAQQ
jgi:hypothetical protein